MKNRKSITLSAVVASALSGCIQVQSQPPSVPSLDYAQQFRSAPPPVYARPAPHGAAATPSVMVASSAPMYAEPKAQIRFIDGEGGDNPQVMAATGMQPSPEFITNEGPGLHDVHTYRSSAPMIRDYQGPLALGDPGVSASLWRESRGANDMLRDDRAWQSGDLLTIIVSEKDQGSRQAKTDTKSETTLGAALNALFGLPQFLQGNNDPKYGDVQGGIDPDNLIKGSSTQEFKGEGKTDRKNSLTAKISAMVAEVLPTGILRIEGKKIISVNDEEQIMIISGLVRTRDVSSVNEIDSSKIANMRIDYYGKGTVDEAQTPGWGTRLIRNVWPF